LIQQVALAGRAGIEPDDGGAERRRVLADARLVGIRAQAEDDPVGQARPHAVVQVLVDRELVREAPAQIVEDGEAVRRRHEPGQQRRRGDEGVGAPRERRREVHGVRHGRVVDDDALDLAAVLLEQRPVVGDVVPREAERLQPGVLALGERVAFVREDARLRDVDDALERREQRQLVVAADVPRADEDEILRGRGGREAGQELAGRPGDGGGCCAGNDDAEREGRGEAGTAGHRSVMAGPARFHRAKAGPGFVLRPGR